MRTAIIFMLLKGMHYRIVWNGGPVIQWQLNFIQDKELGQQNWQNRYTVSFTFFLQKLKKKKLYNKWFYKGNDVQSACRNTDKIVWKTKLSNNWNVFNSTLENHCNIFLFMQNNVLQKAMARAS